MQNFYSGTFYQGQMQISQISIKRRFFDTGYPILPVQTKQISNTFSVLGIKFRKFFGLPDPDSSLFVRIRILQWSSKKVRKTFISNVLCVLNDILSSKVISKNTNFLLASWKPLTKKAGSGSWGQWCGMRIRIHNTAFRYGN